MTTKEVQKLLDNTDNVSKRKGQFKYWKSYFWRPIGGSEALAQKLQARIPNATITGHGEHYHDFVGSAKSGSSKDSYLWVTFTA